MPSQNLDPVTVSILIFSTWMGPVVAETLGPYAVITVAAVIGAGWSLGRRPTTSRLSAAGYFSLISTTAICTTWGISGVISHYTGMHSQWLYIPVAMFIGGVGSDWPRVGQWLVHWMGRVLDATITRRKPRNPYRDYPGERHNSYRGYSEDEDDGHE